MEVVQRITVAWCLPVEATIKMGLLTRLLGLALGGLGIDHGLELGAGHEFRHGRCRNLQGGTGGGFLPVRAARLADLNVPKPTSCTASPFFTAV